MSSIKDLDINQLKILIDEKIGMEKKAPVIFKKLVTYYNNFLKIKSKSIDREDFENKINKIISKEKNKNFVSMLNTLMRFVNDELYSFGTFFLELRCENNKFRLESVTNGYLKNTPERRLWYLRTTSYSFPIDYVSLIPEAYLKFENYMKDNLDVLDWFDVLINNVRIEVLNDKKKLTNYIQMLYENLSEENKILALKGIESDNDLKNVYDGLCKYADVYNFANVCRRNGKTLDYGIENGIEEFKDSNIHLQNLLIKHKDLKDVIEYLHNSYYKTKFKKFNDF